MSSNTYTIYHIPRGFSRIHKKYIKKISLTDYAFWSIVKRGFDAQE